MFATSRRDLILDAAAAAAALGLDRSLAIAAPRRHRHAPDPARGFVRYKVGDAECTALYDGVWEKAHDPAFFSNATVAETKRALSAAGPRRLLRLLKRLPPPGQFLMSCQTTPGRIANRDPLRVRSKMSSLRSSLPMQAVGSAQRKRRLIRSLAVPGMASAIPITH